ncbi:hypothetical protein TCAL_09442 [Tigriopus californicus]|uniref:Peptidase S1 domain-containing protein n=1 Tax=Tigriopus californicus TaxID=6832 RepID=A0A553PRE7_TIGCA|nr:prostasin-like [Tigriopus californicus]TRY80258.1 hypothetical protein TCAL_09442 [Tigriopus californicus]
MMKWSSCPVSSIRALSAFGLILGSILILNSGIDLVGASEASDPVDPIPSTLLHRIRDKYLVKMDSLNKPIPFDDYIKHVPLTEEKAEQLKKIVRVVRKKRRKQTETLKREKRGDSFKTWQEEKKANYRQGRQRGATVEHLSEPSPYDFSGVCGQSRESYSLKLKPSFRILNGTCSKYGDHPWIAQIQIRDPSNPEFDFKHHCGGTIISKDHILSAAHCFQGHHHSYMRVVIGQNHLDKTEDNELAFDVQDVLLHPDWDSPKLGRYSNDIAVLKIRRKGGSVGISFSDNVAPACLPSSDTWFEPGMECIIAGWGKTEAGSADEGALCLQTAAVPLINTRECREMYSISNRNIVDGMTCAGYQTGGVDSCKGDSGGPLTCKVNGRYHLYGVVSWGDGCGQRNKPGVYSRVQHYLQWIHDTLRKL